MKGHLLAITYLYYCYICASIVSVSLSMVKKGAGPWGLWGIMSHDHFRSVFHQLPLSSFNISPPQ